MIKSIRETARLTSTTRSPMLSLLSETINGASTIRAFKRQDEFINTNNNILNQNIKAIVMMSAVNSWFAIRVDLIAVSVMFFITLTCVFTRDYVDPVMLGLLLTYGLNL